MSGRYLKWPRCPKEQIAELEGKLKTATGRDARKIKQKIKNIREAAQRAKKGETHHRR